MRMLLWDGGDNRDRTDDLLLAKQALSQLSYTPVYLLRARPVPSKLNNAPSLLLQTLTLGLRSSFSNSMSP